MLAGGIFLWLFCFCLYWHAETLPFCGTIIIFLYTDIKIIPLKIQLWDIEFNKKRKFLQIMKMKIWYTKLWQPCKLDFFYKIVKNISTLKQFMSFDYSSRYPGIHRLLNVRFHQLNVKSKPTVCFADLGKLNLLMVVRF